MTTPATFVDVLPQRTNRRRPAMEWEVIPEPSGPAVAFLTLHNDRDTCSYRVEEFPASGGFGVCLVKLAEGSGTDKSEASYCLLCSRERVLSCECKGFVRFGYCRHADAISAALANNWLSFTPEQPAQPREEQCGFCCGRGTVPGPTNDREGRELEPRELTCEYCGGSGVCEDGNKLLPHRRLVG